MLEIFSKTQIHVYHTVSIEDSSLDDLNLARIDSVYEIQISNSHVSDTGISEFRGRIGEEFKGNDNAGRKVAG